MQRHQFDGAGNRLPALIPEHHLAERQAPSKHDKEKRSTDWSDTVQAGLSDRNFNVLQNESSLGRGQREPIAQWSDNRVHYDGVYSYQYDGSGNRIKRSHIDGSSDRYGYDGDQRLVHHCAMNEAGQITRSTENDYDALGRRIRKRTTLHTTNATNVTQTTHYGWDGDRLVYVETEHSKTHTVYEPGSFVPLLRITQATLDKAGQSQHAKAKADAMALLGIDDEENGDQESNAADSADTDTKDSSDWQAMNAGLSSASQSPLPELAKQILRDMGMNPDDVHRDLKRQAKQQKAKTRESLTVHLYHCNHLGTPVALINEQGQIDWAIELDAWGNTVNEYHANPSNPIEQPIRMQGQQLDKDSGLFYNRHRFYDPQLGRYINQDPIGLAGGQNLFSYPNDPLNRIDPLGLEPGTLVQRGYPQNASIWTDGTTGTTLFYDPNTKDVMQIQTSNAVHKSAQPGAANPYDGEITYCELGLKTKEYGTSKIRTTDSRYRWIHGGGSAAERGYKSVEPGKRSLAPRQGWYPTMGCTRGQNEDVEALCKKIKEFQKNNPKASIKYSRYYSGNH